MAKPLNIMMLVGEDTGRHQGCYGDHFARTPNLDRLAAEGCLFRNAYSTAPVCAPSRATMVTGQHPIKIGTHLMRSRLNHPPKLFTQELQDAGYFVNWTNKTDFNFHNPEGFASEQTDWREALASGDLNHKPFFLFMNFEMSHESGMWPPEVKARGHLDARPEPDPRAEDQTLDELPGLDIPPYLPDTRTTRASLVRYYEKLEEQDLQIGRCLKALERSGQAENTVVIYLTDHGRGLIREKRWCYEAGVHLPLIVRGPAGSGMTKPGSIRDDLVSWVDLAPTFHALAGLKPAERYDGRVFLGDQQEPEPETVFFARDRMDSSHDKVRGTADRRYLFLRNDRPDIPYAQFSDYMQISPVTAQARQRYVDGLMRFPEDLWMSPEKTKFELYDKFADPHCVHNLSERSDHQDTVQRMLKLVDDWCKRVDDKGEIPEQQLIDAGVIDDQIDEYNQRLVHKLEEPYRAGGLYDVHRDPTRV